MTVPFGMEHHTLAEDLNVVLKVPSALCRRGLLLHAALQEHEGLGQDLVERVLCSFRLLPFVKAHDPDLLGGLILCDDLEAEPRGHVVAGLALRMSLNAIEGPLNGLLVF